MTAVAESFQLAVQLHQSGELAKAEKLYRQVIRMDPTHSDALHHLGRLETVLNRHVAAVDFIGQAIDINANSAEYWTSLGEVYRALGQTDKSIEALQQAIGRDPQSTAAYVQLGLVLGDCGEQRGAEACFRHALQVDRNNAEAHLQLGMLLFFGGNRDAALESFSLAAALSPGCADVCCARAAEIERTGRFDDARAMYESVYAGQPSCGAAALGIAHVLLSQRRLDESRDWYVRGLAVESTNAAGWINLGCIESTFNRHEEAAACFRKAIEVDPRCAAAHFNLGNSLALQGRDDDAEAAYRRTLEIDACHAGALKNLGNLQVAAGRFAEAEGNYRRALDAQANDAGLLVNLGQSLKEQKRYNDAIECYRQALEHQPENAAVQYVLARTLDLAGRSDEALAAYERTIEMNPDDAQARYHLGNAYKAVGRMHKAVEMYQAARAIDPGHVGTLYQLGNAYRNQKRYDDARGCYEEVLRLRPDDFDTMISLGNVLKAQDDLPAAAARYRTVLNVLPDQPLWRLWIATLCPTVFHSSVGIDDYRQRLLADLKRLARKHLSIRPEDITQCGCPPPYVLQFHGRDDRPLKEAYARVFENTLRADTPLPRRIRPRVGFVVTDGHEGVFLRYLGAIVDRLNPGLFETWIICSAGGKARIESDAHPPRCPFLVVPSRFDKIVETIREANFDVLYHWEVGSDVTNYFLPFFRLAPVQCTGNGLPATSGIPHMDYFITDGLAEPPRADRHYTEKLVRFASTTSLQKRLQRPEKPRTREEFGFTAKQHLYVCPHKIEKFHPDLDEIFRDILRRDPVGIVVIPKDREGYAARKLRGRLQLTAPDVFDRIAFVPYQTLHGYLSLTCSADVLLDPLHYGGGLTTFDGFSLNQPIVTLPGEFLRGRFTLGLYERMGIRDCIADSPESYAQIATRIACNDEFRAELRRQIRERSDVLFDDVSAVAEYERCFSEWIAKSRSRMPRTSGIAC